MSVESWGDTRSEDGAGRRIILTKVPLRCRLKDILSFFGQENLEGVSLTKPRGEYRTGFVQFKRPYDCTRTLSQQTISVGDKSIWVRAFISEPATKKSENDIASLSLRYGGRRSSSHDDPNSKRRRDEPDKRPNDWGTTIGETQHNSHSEPRKSHQTKSSSFNEGLTYVEQAQQTSENNGNSEQIAARPFIPNLKSLVGDDWKVTEPTGQQVRHHLQPVVYGTHANTHLFGKAPVLTNTSSHLGLTNPPDYSIHIHQSNSDVGSTVGPTLPVCNLPEERNDQLPAQTLQDSMGLLLQFILNQKSAQGLSVQQIDMLQDYLNKEKQAVLENTLIALKTSNDTPDNEQQQKVGFSDNDKNSQPLDADTQELREKLKLFKKS